MKFALVLALIFTLSCDRPKKKDGGGVVDSGGGGDFIYNSEEEVVRAIDEVWAHSVAKDLFFNPALMALNLLKIKNTLTADERIAKEVLTRAISSGPPHFSQENLSTNTDYLRNAKYKLNTTGFCQGPHDHNYLASVTRLNRSAEVCFSVYGLMRTPSGSLNYDLYGLLAHEVAHMNGYGEPEARAVQRYILKNIKRLLRQNNDHARWVYMREVSKDADLWITLIRYDHFDQDYAAAVYDYAQLVNGFTHKIVNELVAGVEQPNLRGPFESRAEVVANEIRAFALRVLEDVKAGRTQVGARDLQEMRRLALAVMEVESLMMRWVYGDYRIQSENFTLRGEERLIEEINLISYVTKPEMLTHPEKRMALFCTPSPKGVRNLEDELENLSTFYRTPRRCENLRAPEDN